MISAKKTAKIERLIILKQLGKILGVRIYPILRYCILLGPPGCAQVFPYLSPGLLDFFGGIKTANKPHASRNYTQDH